MLILTGAILLIIAAVPYVVYLCGIAFGKKSQTPPVPDSFPRLSIVFPAYNEESVVERRIRNIYDSSYPKGLYEIIMVNDCSTDNTVQKAETVLSELNIPHKILSNTERLGTNRSFNRGISNAENDIVVTTGADLFFAKDALNLVVSRLLSDPEIAAVCADMQPSGETSSGSPGEMEQTYRSFYGRMCEWESFVDSTANFNGGLIVFKREVFDHIRERRGPDDANTAFEAIRRGHRAVYEIRALVYEDMPEKLDTQYRQKSRRATRLIEATLSNLDLLRDNRPFSHLIYPMRIMINVLCPALFFIGGSLFLIGLFLLNAVAALIPLFVLAVLLIFARASLISTFVANQWYLLLGLLNLGKDMRVWESTSKKV